MSKRVLGETLPLQFFVRKKQILSLYRNLIRNAKKIKDIAVQKELVLQIRGDFHRNKQVRDSLVVKGLIQEGNSSLKTLQGMVYKDNKAQSTTAGASWLDQRDAEDKRGRVGEGWPWG